MCVPFRLASVVLPLPAPPPWLVCCLQCVWGACVPRKRGVPGWPGTASEILHSGTHLPSSKASVPRRKDQQKEGLPSLHSHSAMASIGHAPFPFRLSLSQGMPQLRHTPATARQGWGGGLELTSAHHLGPHLAPSPPLRSSRLLRHSASTQGQVARGWHLKTWCGILRGSSWRSHRDTRQFMTPGPSVSIINSIKLWRGGPEH